MLYAELAIHRPIRQTFTYVVPDTLDGAIKVGQLVLVEFGTAKDAGIVIRLHDETPEFMAKPIIEILDPKPVVTTQQIVLAHWMSERYLAPIGECLWLMLPTGIVGRRDIRVKLIDDSAQPQDTYQAEIIALLQKRKKALKGEQIQRALKHNRWTKAVRELETVGIVTTTSMLNPPRIKPKKVQVARLDIHPDHIPNYTRHLGKQSREADVIQVLADADDDLWTAEDILNLHGIGSTTLNHLLDDKLLTIHDDDHLTLNIAPEDVDDTLLRLRQGEADLHILRVLGREDKPVAVSWIYAQTDATIADLRRLEARGLIWLGEKQAIRDSLANLDVELTAPPKLTSAQKIAWGAIREAINATLNPINTSLPTIDPSLALPNAGEGIGHASIDVIETSHTMDATSEARATTSPIPSPMSGGAGRGLYKTDFVDWRPSKQLWAKLKPLAQEMRQNPTRAENHLWQHLRKEHRKNQMAGMKFRRQHPIDRFIVDFYCHEVMLVIEVDGEIHQYTVEEDAIRQEFLENFGLRVIRFTNTEIFTEIDRVLNEIQDVIQARKALHDNPSLALPNAEEGIGHTSIDVIETSHTMDATSEARTTTRPTPPSMSGEAGRGVYKKFLLHGVTGSGKTEIYLRAIEYTLALGRQAILLVPEIALTAQTVRRVMARFPGRVTIIGEEDGNESGGQVALSHGRLSAGERYDTWRRARAGELGVVIGTRSALFTSLPDVGLVILDEEHDASYKQSPPFGLQVYYHARDVAEQMMHQNNGVLMLGSATPDLGTMYRAQRDDIGYLHLPDRIMGHRMRVQTQSERAGVLSKYTPDEDSDAVHIDLPPVDIVDMRVELKAGNTSIFSSALHDALTQTLNRGEQAILFLNRRGTATYIFCRDCGYVAGCPRCDTPMTYHGHGSTMHCHHCGHKETMPTQCPDCNSKRIRFFGAGTQHIEAEIRTQFPDAISLRWDADTAQSADAHDIILQRFVRQEAQILIGTQMIAKGLDLPLVTLVGVVSADHGLNLPDFRAGERIFQILTQVAGRAGRGLLGGQVILQTYEPDHYVIQAASEHDYDDFYQTEIAYRRELGYPPFRRMVRLLFRYDSEPKARFEAERAHQILEKRLQDLEITDTEMIGPVPCFFSRVNRMYRWQILLRGANPARLLEDLDIARGWFIDIDPVDIL